MNKRETVYVGLSGGVDSSVAAKRLIDQGYEVVGVFIKVWHPDFLVCDWEAERLDAMRVAAHLEIPFLTCDGVEAYKTGVADYFIAEYQAGRTPNPDVLCNEMVKFGVFLDFAMAKGADFIATGHYVQKIDGKLHRSVDQNKDQSYFLWSLSQDQLDRSLFPVGDSSKDVIRSEAEAAGLATATKHDSQGICFLGHIDIPEFLSHYTELRPGDVLAQDGTVIGTHQGALVYTLGQRHGFTINSKDEARIPHYVIAKDMSSNTITAAPHAQTIKPGQGVLLTDTKIRAEIKQSDTVSVQFRYRQDPIEASVTKLSDNQLSLEVTTDVSMPSPGQSAVLYRGTECIGGGIVTVGK